MTNYRSVKTKKIYVLKVNPGNGPESNPEKN